LQQENIALLIVAAGASLRLGQPKQLLKKDGLTLLQNTLNIARQSKIGEVFLVLGANADLILDEVQVSGIQCFVNETWTKGMGGSIALGVQQLTRTNVFTGIIISVSDQPYLTSETFKNIAKVEKREDTIICSKYVEGSGPPVYFSKKYFEELKQLTGDKGAKPLIKKYRNQVVEVDFLRGNIDVDRVEDLLHWK